MARSWGRREKATSQLSLVEEDATDETRTHLLEQQLRSVGHGDLDDVLGAVAVCAPTGEDREER